MKPNWRVEAPLERPVVHPVADAHHDAAQDGGGGPDVRAHFLAEHVAQALESDSVLLEGADRNPANALHLAVDQQGRILGGVIPISGTRIISLNEPQ